MRVAARTSLGWRGCSADPMLIARRYWLGGARACMHAAYRDGGAGRWSKVMERLEMDREGMQSRGRVYRLCVIIMMSGKIFGGLGCSEVVVVASEGAWVAAVQRKTVPTNALRQGDERESEWRHSCERREEAGKVFRPPRVAGQGRAQKTYYVGCGGTRGTGARAPCLLGLGRLVAVLQATRAGLVFCFSLSDETGPLPAMYVRVAKTSA
ncbi:hypothetical protein BC567DRAFT_30592 [Phyllosticta citribraziliensis]